MMLSLTKILNEIIRKTGNGYTVYSGKKHKGKRKKLSKKYKTKGEAVKRLRQIEYFKHHS